MTILQARAEAQRIAFGPLVFQAIHLLWKSGLLERIEQAGVKGVSAAQLARETDISSYGVDVLCEVAGSAGVIIEEAGRLTITKLGSVILHDRLTQVNVNFVQDVCYEGAFHLEESIRESRPAGLKVFSDASTIYECVTELPDAAQQSWYEFDHYYSDRAFREAAAIVFSRSVSRLLDIGGNTGRWALRALESDDQVRITIADLPGQLERARQILNASAHAERMSYLETNLLDEHTQLPGQFDAIWMSQFLDCFSEPQIGQILRLIRPALAENGRVFIMETFVDRQKYEAAAYSLNAISLYFTTMANGNSRMYRGTTLERILNEEGYKLTEIHDDLGVGHTLLECTIA